MLTELAAIIGVRIVNFSLPETDFLRVKGRLMVFVV